jgi:hypothetical protein
MRGALLVAVTASAVAAGATAGCALPVALVEPTPHVWVGFDPPDGATGQEGRSLVVTVEDGGRLLDEGALAQLAEHVVLKTWPEGTTVAIATEPAVGPVDAAKLIRVTPAVPLDDRWYELGFDDLPPGLTSRARLPDGNVGARFLPGSHPRVARLEFCDAGTAGTRVGVGFSEPIAAVAAPGQVVSLEVAGRPSACAPAGRDGGALFFTCADLAPTAAVTVSIADGIAAASGVALPAASFDVDLASLAPAGVCRDFSPPI